MTRVNFDALCRACCSRKSISECLFADAEEGFIDTSAEGDGSRGIAFSRRKMMVNFDGTIKIVAYKKIRSVHIISSLEGAFADELEISGEHSRLRITDFSLDKHILKQIIEGLCEGIEEPVPEETSGNSAKNVPVYENKIAVGEENARENIENGEVAPEETSGNNAGNVPVYENKIAVGEENARDNAENGEPVPEETSGNNAGNVRVYENKIAVGEENARENAENSEETSGNNAGNVPVYENKIAVGEENARENAENSEVAPEKTSGINAKNVPVYENKIAVGEENARENIENGEVAPEETSGNNAGNVPVYEEKIAVGEENARENAENSEVAPEETSGNNAGNVRVYEDKIAVDEENARENAENSEVVLGETSGNNAGNVPVYEDKIAVDEENARENAENSEVVHGETSGNNAENGDIILDYEDKIEWLSNSADTDIHDEKIEWLSSMTDEETAPVIPETPSDGESEMRDIIGQMSHEETLGFLSKTLGEINAAEPLHEENLPRKITPETVPPSDDESEMRDIIGQMSHEETLGFLSKTLGEINAAEPLHGENLPRKSTPETVPPSDDESEMRDIIGQMSHEETLGFLSRTLGEINGAEPIHEENLPRKSTPETVPPSDDESEMRDIIGQMSHEETLGFLSKTLGEINGAEPLHEENLPRGSDSEPFFPTTQTAVIPERSVIEKIAAQNPPAPKPPAEKPAAHEIPQDNGELSKEPVWGDIYIKASRSLRELCENGRLSMDIIENELRERLLDSARAFADIVKDEQKIPKVLIPKIAELKNAAEHFDEYFSHGEDVGVRVMFFMLYQMLSYSDRIAENPETKERLNDFFRRFGTAGITLSMLDVRG